MENNKVVKIQTQESFFKFAGNIISQLQKNGQHKTWQHYRSTLNSFMRFRKRKDFPVAQMDAMMVESYEAYLKQEDVSRNTSSFYMRILRAIHNRAVEQGLTVQKHPFRHVYPALFIDATFFACSAFFCLPRCRQVGVKSCHIQ